jgi:hypothetical protein
MRYIMLIYGGESAEATLEQRESIMAEYFAFNAEARERGVYRAGDALQSTTTATTVRVRDGGVSTTDGPFAETKEQLGGFYILDCKDLDEALEFAAKIPGAQFGSVEVRPIMEIQGRPG